MKRKVYEQELRQLQAQLCEMQEWVRNTGQRIIMVFEGRDAAGKGGCIRALTERVSPRVFRVQHFPAAGEIVIFDRSWYNRAGVERVMGFCEPRDSHRFLRECPAFERSMIVDNGILFFKFWLEVSEEVQEKRFQDRIDDPVKQWKLSPVDLPSREKWFAYSRARDDMFRATDTNFAPWRLIESDDKRRARLNLIRHVLDEVPYEPQPSERVELPELCMDDAYDDRASLANRRWIEGPY